MDNPVDTDLLAQWVGRSETQHDTIEPRAAVALAASLNHPHAPAAGMALPPLWHWMYFWAVAAQSTVGDDGHPQRGGFLPPVPLPRRMWAGGRLRFQAPLLIGASAARTSRILSVEAKNGQSGELAFVTVEHQIASNGVTCVTEQHDIVYRSLPKAGAVVALAKPASTTARWQKIITPDPVLLFRYSALTFNGHRIHYDRSYVTEVEGYPGLIVHGPLIATLLVDLLLEKMPAISLLEFSFRAVSPLFDIEPFTVCAEPHADGRTIALWAMNHRGELAMQAQAMVVSTLSTGAVE
jgi:3-methylfumaryl-CoA hydratase